MSGPSKVHRYTSLISEITTFLVVLKHHVVFYCLLQGNTCGKGLADEPFRNLVMQCTATGEFTALNYIVLRHSLRARFTPRHLGLEIALSGGINKDGTRNCLLIPIFENI